MGYFSLRHLMKLTAVASGILLQKIPAQADGRNPRPSDIRPVTVPSSLIFKKTMELFSGQQVTLHEPVASGIKIGEMQAWTLSFTQPPPCKLPKVDFHMPQHGHGPGSSPEVVAVPPTGLAFEIRGVVLQMPGWWQVKISCDKLLAELNIMAGNTPPQVESNGQPVSFFSQNELHTMASFSLKNLSAPTTGWVHQPVISSEKMQALGEKLFFTTRLSRNTSVGCATCHNPAQAFTDGKSIASGHTRGSRNTPTLIGAGHQRFFSWDGKNKSLEEQVLTALFEPAEHALNKAELKSKVFNFFQKEFNSVFPMLTKNSSPDEISRAIALSIGAFVKNIPVPRTKFDILFDAAVENGNVLEIAQQFSEAELRGLKLFMGKASCVNCHNGPLFSNGDFHNTGAPHPTALPGAEGRIGQVMSRQNENIICGPQKNSVVMEIHCGSQNHGEKPVQRLIGAFKTPTLRALQATGPWFHSGGAADLSSVVEHYRRAPAGPVGVTEIPPFLFSDEEAQDLVKFLEGLGERPGT